ncbi:hypothetical protein TcWFU_005659 [Taenia crassiceps]|uniref:Uncharacterized protein n=1 Tax=Taenia crassiceps TaxID=6207 RepID=A0ABR4QRI5_9CEST
MKQMEVPQEIALNLRHPRQKLRLQLASLVRRLYVILTAYWHLRGYASVDRMRVLLWFLPCPDTIQPSFSSYFSSHKTL